MSIIKHCILKTSFIHVEIKFRYIYHLEDMCHAIVEITSSFAEIQLSFEILYTRFLSVKKYIEQRFYNA